MNEITRITIKSSSGYCSVDEAYSDRLTITACSIAYEYIPEIEYGLNKRRKWSYRSNSPVFASIFDKICDMMPDILHNDEILMAVDLGPISFSVTYKDKTRDCTSYYCSSNYFYDLFKLIKQLVPEPEYVPVVLLTDDDYDDEKDE